MSATPELSIAYRFPHGYGDQASTMFGRLNHAGMQPTWVPDTPGETCIAIPPPNLGTLHSLQRANPAYWGARKA